MSWTDFYEPAYSTRSEQEELLDKLSDIYEKSGEYTGYKEKYEFINTDKMIEVYYAKYRNEVLLTDEEIDQCLNRIDLLRAQCANI